MVNCRHSRFVAIGLALCLTVFISCSVAQPENPTPTAQEGSDRDTSTTTALTCLITPTVISTAATSSTEASDANLPTVTPIPIPVISSAPKLGTMPTLTSSFDAFGVHLSQSDDGATFEVTLGKGLTLALMAAPGYRRWQPAVRDTRVLMAVPDPAAAAARGWTLAAFMAVGSGQTQLVATSACAASSSVTPMTFSVTIIVPNP